MTDVKLSICIPTYNRSPYLRTALENLASIDFGFSYEIIISDNASTDDTSDVVQEFIGRGLPIDYQRCPVNAGSGPNLTNAIHHARGQYMIYHADDDLLIGEQTAVAIAYLDAHPDVTMVQSPWYLYDEVKGVDTQTFYQLEEDRRFEAQEFVEMFDFIVQGHIFPEIGIYRMDAVRTAYLPRNFCFWPFAYLAHYLDQGAVVFLKEPFYRFVLVSKIAPQRQQGGNEDVMTGWDMYRGGLEYFLYVAMQRGKLRMTKELRDTLDRMCTLFTVTRMMVAIRFWVARNDYIRAYELYTRVALAGYGDHPGVTDYSGQFPAMVALQTLAFKIGSMPDISHLLLAGMDNPDHVANLLHDLGLPEHVVVVADAAAHDPALIGKTAALVTSAETRAALLAAGYDARFIFADTELTHYVLI